MVADALINVLNADDLIVNSQRRGFDLDEYKEKTGHDKVHISPARLSEHYTGRKRLDSDLLENCKKINEKIGTVKHRNNPDQQEYLDSQLDKYVVEHPQWELRLRNGGIVDVLGFGLEVAKAGMGQHDSGFNPDFITEAFDVDNPARTKCAVFNMMYQVICERTIGKFNPALGESYSFIHTGSAFALDLPRNKNDYIKMIRHAFVTLISEDDDGRLRYTPIDPYHEESGTSVEQKLDFSETRSLDSLEMVLNLVFADYWNGYSLDKAGKQVKGVALTEMVKSAPDAVNAGEVALLLSYQWRGVFEDSTKARVNFESKRKILAERVHNFQMELERFKSEGRDVDMKTSSYLRTLRDHCVSMYNRQNENYQELKHKMEFVENNRTEFKESMKTAVGGLMEEIVKGGEVNSKAALIFFDLVDNIGSFGIEMDEEDWVKIVGFIESQRAENLDEWKKTMSPGARREWKSYLRRHYENTWGTQPVETVVLKEDNLQVDENDSRYAYTLYRAQVLKLISAAGVNSWKKFLPKSPPEGSYSDLMVRLIQQED